MTCRCYRKWADAGLWLIVSKATCISRAETTEDAAAAGSMCLISHPANIALIQSWWPCALIDSTVTHIIMHTLIIYVYIDHARTRTHLHTHTCNIVCNTIYIWYICMYAVWHVYPLYNVCVAASCRPFFFPLRLPAYVCVFLCFYMLLFHLNYLTIIMTFGKAAMASITWHKDLPWK